VNFIDDAFRALAIISKQLLIASTMLLVPIVGVVVLIELPIAALTVIVVVQYTFRVKLIDPTALALFSVFINLAIVLSYPVDFFVFCSMSRQFRATFVAMITCSSGQPSTNTSAGRTCARDAAAVPDALMPAGATDGGDVMELLQETTTL